MSRTAMWSRRLFAAGLFSFVFANLQASAQQPVYVKEDAHPPISPSQSPGPMTLDQCIQLGFQHQPALDAARASVNAAHAGSRSIDRLILPRLFMRDYKIRREQAHLGVTIADAGMNQAVWETRYAITRNYFTMQFIDAQGKIVDEVLDNLVKARARAKKIFDNPPPDSKITQIDLDQIDIGIVQVRGKKSQVVNGRDKALAALREAMGLGFDYPLEVTAYDLTKLAVYEVKVALKDEKGKPVMKDGKEVMVIEYHPIHSFNKGELISAAIASRGELVQAQTALQIAQLEVSAQYRKFGFKAETFAAGGDVHSKMVPQSVFNSEYRPGGFRAGVADDPGRQARRPRGPRRALTDRRGRRGQGSEPGVASTSRRNS